MNIWLNECSCSITGKTKINIILILIHRFHGKKCRFTCQQTLLDSNLIRNIIVISITWTFFFDVSKLVKFLVRNQYSQKKLLYFVKRDNGGYLKSNTIEFSRSKVNSHLFLSENSYHLKCCSALQCM